MIKISTDQAPAAIGPYSQGFIVDNLVFTSGQIPADPATGEIVGADITAQAHQSCKNVGAVLEAGGASFAQVVKTTCFLADMGTLPPSTPFTPPISPAPPPAAAWPSRTCPGACCVRSRPSPICNHR